MTTDKLKQYVAMIGGILGALLLFVRAIGHEISWFNEMTIEAFIVLLSALIPLAAIFYGIYKNQYLLSIKENSKCLRRNGLK
jgi:predicted transporter